MIIIPDFKITGKQPVPPKLYPPGTPPRVPGDKQASWVHCYHNLFQKKKHGVVSAVLIDKLNVWLNQQA